MIGLVAMRIERMKVAEFGMRWLQGIWCLVLAMKISRTINPRFASGHLDNIVGVRRGGERRCEASSWRLLDFSTKYVRGALMTPS